jgi:hypothetical protein
VSKKFSTAFPFSLFGGGLAAAAGVLSRMRQHPAFPLLVLSVYMRQNYIVFLSLYCRIFIGSKIFTLFLENCFL